MQIIKFLTQTLPFTNSFFFIHSSKSNSPLVWAQRKDKIWVTIDVPEIDKSSLKVEITENKLVVHAKAPSKDVEIDVNLYGKVTDKDAKYAVFGKNTTLVIQRAEEGEYWPRLAAETIKYPWVRVDWAKWVDEDDQDAPPADMSGYSGMPDFGGMDFSSMGGMGGMGGMGDMGGYGADDYDDEDDEDDDEGHDHSHEGHDHSHEGHDHSHEGHDHSH